MKKSYKTKFTYFLLSLIFLGQTQGVQAFDKENDYEVDATIANISSLNLNDNEDAQLPSSSVDELHQHDHVEKKETDDKILENKKENPQKISEGQNEEKNIEDNVIEETKNLEALTQIEASHSLKEKEEIETVTDQEKVLPLRGPIGEVYENIRSKNQFGDQEEPPITSQQLVSGQIAKVYENIRLNNIHGDQKELFEKYMQNLKEKFGDQPEEIDWETYCPNAENREKLKILNKIFLDTTIDDSNSIKLDSRKLNEKEKFTKVTEEGHKIENYFHSLFANNPQLDEAKVTDESIETLLTILNDKYANYFSTMEDLLQFVDQSSSPHKNYGGGFALRENKAYISSVVKGTGTYLSGIKEGDQLLELNGIKIEEDTVSDPQKFLKVLSNLGKGTPIFTLKRGDQILELPCFKTEDETLIPIVTSEQFGSVGIIKINSFAPRTATEFEKELEGLKQKEIKELIIDLRNNSGGQSGPLYSILDILMKDKKIETIILGGGQKLENYTSSKCTEDIETPLTLITNYDTASASETLVGALKDNLDAKIVGENTFGKGQGQTIFPGPSETAIKHTIYEIVSPKGTHYNEVGFKPDYPVSISSAQKISALRLAGLSPMNIQLRDYAAVINQQEPILADFVVKQKDAQHFAPVDFLTSLSLSIWNKNEDAQKIYIQDKMGQSHEFNYILGTEVNETNVPFISIEEFSKFFPEIKYEKKDNQHFFHIDA